MKKIPGNDGKRLRDKYKCIKYILPRAKSARFLKDEDGSLVFNVWGKDEKRPDKESGYLSADGGDSGSPFLKSTEDDQKKERKVIVAVQTKSHITPRNTEYSDDPGLACRPAVTKVSSDIVRWIKTLNLGWKHWI